MTFDLRYMSTFQGLASGTGNKDYKYGGKIDAFVNLDSGKMGLWNGGGLGSHLEYRHGDAPAQLGGALFSPNTALFWPVDQPDEWVVTSLYFTQKVGDRSKLSLGRFNPVDLLAAESFVGGWGIDRFMNLILAAPPSGLVPVVFVGAIASVKTDPVTWTVMVFDPNDRTDDPLPGDLFEDGVNVFVSGAHGTTLGGRLTTYTITGIYSTAEGTDFSVLGPGLTTTTTKDGAYNLSLEFKHNLQESTVAPNAGWAVYLKLATADGNPNYVQSSVIVGVGGKALFLGRPQDSFGLGVFRYNLSNALQDSVSGVTRFGDESAIEVFYSCAVTPWLQIGADIQIIRPAAGSFEDALIPALRTQIRF